MTFMPHFHSLTYSTGQSRNFHFSFHHFGNFMSRIQPTSYSNTLKHNISQSTKSSWLPFHCIQIFRLLSTWLWRLLKINNQLARLLNTMLSILRNRWDNIITMINIVSIIINIKIPGCFWHSLCIWSCAKALGWNSTEVR